MRRTNCTSCSLRQLDACCYPVATLHLQIGTDVDALAVKAARDNADLNSVGDRFTGIQCSSSIQVHTLTTCRSCGVSPAGLIPSVCIMRRCMQPVGPLFILNAGEFKSQVECCLVDNPQSRFDGTLICCVLVPSACAEQ